MRMECARLALAFSLAALWAQPGRGEASIRVLFLGDQGPHQPARRAERLIPVLAERGIAVHYTDDVGTLAADALEPFDGLMLYANTPHIAPAQEEALLDFVARGRGLVAIHCASYCFLNSDKYVALVGAQFKEHGTGVFATLSAAPDHPLMRGFEGFESWDETYVHHRHNEQGRTVLEYRVGGLQADGAVREPWTWVREEGKGRVFYTAWGHDERTWSHPGFHNLLERAVRWSCGRETASVPPYRDPDLFRPPVTTAPPRDPSPFEYVDVGGAIPNYTPGARWGTQGESFSRMQKPLAPEESLRRYATPVGFELRLFASEKDFQGKPIAMNWDHRGRLWVCETVDYPNDHKESGRGNDRLRICEDSDGDGVADAFTVFAEGLSIPTAIVCVHGGAVVQNGTETLFLKDVDGDDRADVREVLISNWALGDTHGGVSNFHYGHDNWIWGVQGYNASEPVVEGVKQARFSMGFFRFKLTFRDGRPVVEALEFLKSAYGNTWGLGFSEEGLVFGSSANGHPSLYSPIPNRYYERVRGWAPSLLAASIADSARFHPITDKVRQVDHHGSYSAAAGHAVYTARNYPRPYWNRTAFVCGPEGHLVGVFVLHPDGADFHSTSPGNLVASDDEWAAPIMAEVGPDGNVWILDWYNYIVQHNPTPVGFKTGKGNAYETELRDKRHGRIYRLLYTGPTDSPAPPPFALDPADLEGLLAALDHPTLRVRLQAQRLLVERGGGDAAPALAARVLRSEGSPLGVLHAIYTLAGLGELSSPSAASCVAAALEHPFWGVRRAALLTLPAGAPFPVERLVDAHPQARLAALLALADRPAGTAPAGAVERLAELALDPETMQDRWLADGVAVAAANCADAFLAAVFSPRSRGPRSDAGAAAPVVRIVAEHCAREGLSTESLERLLLSMQEAPGPALDAFLSGFAKGWPAARAAALSPEAEKALADVWGRLRPEGRVHLLRLAERLQTSSLSGRLERMLADFADVVQDATRTDDERLQAARSVVDLAPDEASSVELVLKGVNAQASPELAAGLLEALRGAKADLVGAAVVEGMAVWTPTARSSAVRLLLSRPTTARALLEGIEKGRASWEDLSLDQQQGLLQHPDKSLAARAARLMKAGGGLPDPDRERVLQKLLPLAERRGDVVRGRDVYQRHCAKCHRHGETGAEVGPNLTGFAVHPKADILLHVVDPNRSVEANYRAYTILLADGRVQNGMLAAESRTALEVVDSDGKRHSIAREDVEKILPSTKSLMPEGFERQMKEDEIVDLLEFLAARGKFVPLDLRRAATVATTQGMFTAKSAEGERLVFSDWGPKTFQGVPFVLVDPRGGAAPNAVMLKGPLGEFPPRMPSSVRLPVHQPAQAIHILGGVGGWNYPAHPDRTVSMIVRLHYESGEKEDHKLINGEHLADYIRRVDVPGSKLAFMLGEQQLRYLAITPRRPATIREIELVKGEDPTAPIVMAITVESP